ncbi:lysosomal amino acid transporter 1-like [Glandiceps talaboti]
MMAHPLLFDSLVTTDIMLTASSDPNCSLGNQGIYEVFKQCVTYPVQYVGFALGLISLVCWIFFFSPQIYENIKRGKMDEGVSFFFLFIWMLGDLTNLLGCILAHQLPVQYFIASWYVFMDIFMISQYAYYYTRNKRRKELEKLPVSDQSVNNDSISTSGNFNNGSIVYCIACFSVVSLLSLLPWQQTEYEDMYSSNTNAASRTLLGNPMFHDSEDIVGYVFGIVSSIFYLSARVPQIMKNYSRKSVEGVSMCMFILSIVGNSTYGASIIMQNTTPTFIIDHLPWLIGSLGTLAFDATLIFQFYLYDADVCRCCYRPSKKTRTGEREPLLQGQAPIVEVL